MFLEDFEVLLFDLIFAARPVDDFVVLVQLFIYRLEELVVVLEAVEVRGLYYLAVQRLDFLHRFLPRFVVELCGGRAEEGAKVQLLEAEPETVPREECFFWHIVPHPVMERVPVCLDKLEVLVYNLAVLTRDDPFGSYSNNPWIVTLKYLFSIDLESTGDQFAVRVNQMWRPSLVNIHLSVWERLEQQARATSVV